jgi:hypothetical protein
MEITLSLDYDAWLSVLRASLRGIRAYENDQYDVISVAMALGLTKDELGTIKPKYDKSLARTEKARAAVNLFQTELSSALEIYAKEE